jgi:hypothetical protein
VSRVLRRRPPPGPAGPAALLWPPAPGSGDLDAWLEAREKWHAQHAVGGRSPMGDRIELLQVRRLAALLRAHAEEPGLCCGLEIPLPPRWWRSWGERPDWLRGDYVPALRVVPGGSTE